MVLLKIKHLGIMSLFLIAFGTMIMSTTFAQTAGPSNPNENVTTAYKLLHPTNNSTINSTISVQTDLPSYKLGDTIILTGHVSNLQGSSSVSIRTFNPNQNLISIKQFLPSSDGSFTTTIFTVLPTWSESGVYTIVTQYGPYLSTKTTFNFLAQSTAGTISLTTDKPSYSPGNTILISGKVQGNILQGVPMSIRIITPTNMIGLVDSLPVSSDGTFSKTLTVTGPEWTEPGTYTVIVQYGSSDITTRTTYQIAESNSDNTTPSSSNATAIPTPHAKIPQWVKSVFGFYAQGNLSDDDLIQALQFLIKQGIIKVS